MEYIVYADSNRFMEIENLSKYNNEPTAFNSLVRIKKYKITVEEIKEPIEVMKERLKELYKKETNYHNKEALNQYSRRLFGANVNEVDKEFSEAEKIKRILAIVERARENENIDLSIFDWVLRSIRFEYYKSENFFTYTAKYITNDKNYTPYKNTSTILTFKTLAGAKRNFIKKFLQKDN